MRFEAGELSFREVFEVSSNARRSTKIIDLEIYYHDQVGYGQASFPPYMVENREKNLEFLSNLDISRLAYPFRFAEIHQYLDKVSPVHRPAKAAVDMALHDLAGKLTGQTVSNYLMLEPKAPLFSSFTIGIGSDEFLLRQLDKAGEFPFLKIKLGAVSDYNRHAIDLIRRHSNLPLGVDFNQGLQDRETAIRMVEWLSGKGVEYIEQPMPVASEDDYLWLKSRSPMDIIGDESIQTPQDIINKKELFHGVNIKLMKCGGIYRAHESVRLARQLGLKTMLGCMVESTCAITAAAHLGALFDRLDLDGSLNIADDPYTGMRLEHGRIIMPGGAGTGVRKAG